MPQWWNNQGNTVVVHKGDRLPALRRVIGSNSSTVADCSADIEVPQDITMRVQNPPGTKGARTSELRIEHASTFGPSCIALGHALGPLCAAQHSSPSSICAVIPLRNPTATVDASSPNAVAGSPGRLTLTMPTEIVVPICNGSISPCVSCNSVGIHGLGKRRALEYCAEQCNKACECVHGKRQNSSAQVAAAADIS